MRTILKVNRAACCVLNNSLNRELAAINGVYGVMVDNYKNEVTIDHTNEVSFREIEEKLEENDYQLLPGQIPEKKDYSNMDWPD
jgi:hypothetical protein